MNDAEVIGRILSGDEALFSVLVERYGQRVWAQCMAYARNASDCDDLAQEAFVQCYRSLDTLRNPQAFGYWLSRLTRRQCLMWLRSRGRRERVLSAYEDRLRHVDAAPAAVEERLDQEEWYRRLRRTIERLPRRYREAVSLCYIRGQSAADAAQFLGIRPKTLHKRLERARRMLKEELWRDAEAAFAARKPEERIAGAVLAAIPFGQAPWLKGAAGASFTAPTGAVLGGLVMKKTLLAVTIAAIAALGLWAALREEPAPKGPVAVAVEAEPAVAPTPAPSEPAPPAPVEEAEAPAQAVAADDTPAADRLPYTIYVDVSDESGKPAARCRVALSVLDSDGQSVEWQPPPLDTALTDAEGQVVLKASLAPQEAGRYRLFAIEGEGSGAYERRQFGGSPLVLEYDMHLVLRAGTPVTGRVLTPRGEPVAGAGVLLVPSEDERVSPDVMEIAQAHSAADGSFRFAAVPKGRWRLYVRAEGFAPRLSEPFTPDGSPVEVVLGAGGSLSGRIECTETRRAVEGVRVRLQPVERSRPRTSEPAPPQNAWPEDARTEAGGTFRFAHLMPGEYLAYVDDAHWASDGAPVSVTIADGREKTALTLRATAGATVRGRVYDAVTGRGLPGVRVRATALSPYLLEQAARQPLRIATADDDGSFALEHLGEGECWVFCTGGPGLPFVSAPNPTVAGKTIEVSRGATIAGVDLPMEIRGSISGTVVDPEGRPVPNASVRAQALDAEANSGQGAALSDAEGRFRLCVGRRSQRVVLRARRGNLHTPPAEPLNVGDRLEDVVLTLQPGQRVDGIAVDSSGRPLSKTWVLALPTGADPNVEITEYGLYRSPEAGRVRQTDTGGAGRFRYRDLPPGVYAFYLLPFDRAPVDLQKAAEVEVKAGEPLSGLKLMWETQGEGAVEGTVTYGGRPVADAFVYILNKSGRTDASGVFRVEGLEPGTVHVAVQMFGGGSRMTARDVEVAQGRTSRVDFEFAVGNGAVEGFVRRDGEPAADAEWRTSHFDAAGNEYMDRGVTDAEGRYRVEGVGDGQLLLVVGLQAEERRLTVQTRGDATVSQDVELASGGRVVGHLEGLPGDRKAVAFAMRGDVSVPELSVETLQSLEPRTVARTDVRADGRFFLEALEPGRWTVGVASYPATVSSGPDMARHFAELRLDLHPVDIAEGKETFLEVPAR